mmetsp:Transcript_28589/g.67012  ORF Transcript_28589/g.67012 Transcript_28589/m.67012 type:complete len:121 (-) Transcript_28589:49-411(-)
MRELLAPHYAQVLSLTELPSAAPSDTAEWQRMLAAAALSCAGLTLFLKERIDVWFVDAYKELLRALFPDAARLEGVSWAEADELLRRHQLTGGLTPQERERLWSEWCTTVRGRDRDVANT